MRKRYAAIGITAVLLMLVLWRGSTANDSSAPVKPALEEAKPTPVAVKEEAMGKKQYAAPPEMTIDTTAKYTAVLSTDKGDMRIVLDPTIAPVTVNNFVFLAREGLYDNTVFHRIISGFMVQGGDPLGNGTGGPGYRFDDEPVTREYTRGTIAMANSGPDTNGSQFFIMHADNPLPKNYVIFGGIDAADAQSLRTLDAIAQTPVERGMGGEMSQPKEPLFLVSVVIEEE